MWQHGSVRPLPEWSDTARRESALERIAARLARTDPLSRPQLAVTFLLSHGLDYAAIGEMLYMHVTTVSDHAERARLKLGARNNAQLVARALRRGLIF